MCSSERATGSPSRRILRVALNFFGPSRNAARKSCGRWSRKGPVGLKRATPAAPAQRLGPGRLAVLAGWRLPLDCPSKEGREHELSVEQHSDRRQHDRQRKLCEHAAHQVPRTAVALRTACPDQQDAENLWQKE